MSAADGIWDAARMKALAGQLDSAIARSVLGIEIFIDTTVRQDCGCPAGWLCEHPVPPGRLIDLGEPVVHEIRERGGIRQHLVSGKPCDGTDAACAVPAARTMKHGTAAGGWTPGYDPADPRAGIGPAPAGHNGWHASREDCARSGCPAVHRVAPGLPRHTCDGRGTACEPCERIARSTREVMAMMGQPGPEPGAGTSGRPEKQDKPGIPLWDEAGHQALAGMAGPLALPESALPSYEAVPPGCCRGCHLPVPDGQERCFYCTRLAELRQARALAAAGRDKRAREQAETAMLAATTPLQPGCDCKICRAHASQGTLQAELARRRLTCDHGGGRRTYVRDGRCQRCGRVPAVRPARPRYAGHPFINLTLGFVLLFAAGHLAPWLGVFAIVLIAAGVTRLLQGRRR
jgi:hypothetical protein